MYQKVKKQIKEKDKKCTKMTITTKTHAICLEMWWYWSHWQCPCSFLSPLWVTLYPLCQSPKAPGLIWAVWQSWAKEVNVFWRVGEGKEIDVYHVKIKDIMGKFTIGVKHFKVITEADNIFEQEQTLQIAKAIPPASTAAKAQVDPNQEACKATTDVWSENQIIWPVWVTLNTDDVAKFGAHGLEVDGENEPVPENAGLSPAQEQQGVWTVPTTCHQKAAGMSNLKGRWINHPWS